jgi:hypothetical protein
MALDGKPVNLLEVEGAGQQAPNGGAVKTPKQGAPGSASGS